MVCTEPYQSQLRTIAANPNPLLLLGMTYVELFQTVVDAFFVDGFLNCSVCLQSNLEASTNSWFGIRLVFGPLVRAVNDNFMFRLHQISYAIDCFPVIDQRR